jgi:NAD(P)-dependent dehydrogenase (short-subunit alcohol dehydrogenase family)
VDRVKGKVAIVTGAALGIGKASAVLLAKEGASVAVTDVLDRQGGETVDEIVAEGGTSQYWHLDVRRESEVAAVFEGVAQQFGKIDILVNNAGIAGANRPTHELTLEDWDRVMDVNVKGVFLCTKHAIPYMRKARGGSIVNMSSIYGLIGAPDIVPYHASKGAVTLETKTDALIYAADRIRVNAIHPGYIWTPLVEQIGRESSESMEQFRKKLDSLHPLGHVGEPDDIAWGVVYLASDESKFVTGSSLVIDGGYTAR